MSNLVHIFVRPAGVPAWLRRAQAWVARRRALREHRKAMGWLLVHADRRLLQDIGVDRATVIGDYMDPARRFDRGR